MRVLNEGRLVSGFICDSEGGIGGLGVIGVGVFVRVFSAYVS